MVRTSLMAFFYHFFSLKIKPNASYYILLESNWRYQHMPIVKVIDEAQALIIIDRHKKESVTYWLSDDEYNCIKSRKAESEFSSPSSSRPAPCPSPPSLTVSEGLRSIYLDGFRILEPVPAR